MSSPSEYRASPRLRRLALFAGMVLFAVSSGMLQAAGVSAVDDLGTSISLPRPAQRIVALAPHATELLFAAGAGNRVVGVVNYSDYPPAAAEIPLVGGYKSLDYERILALEPDLVVAWVSGNGAPTLKRLRELGLTVYASEPRKLEEVATSLERLGRLAGTESVARPAAESFRRTYSELGSRYRHRPPVSVFYQIWHQPLMTVNGEHLISQVIRLCGGRNVFAELGPLAATVDVEAVLKTAPEVIIGGGMGEQRPDWLQDWRQWPQIPAVARDNLFFIPPSLLQRHSPRVLQGAALLCEQLEQARAKRDQS